MSNLQQLLRFMPPHEVYTEAYGNGEAFLFCKPKSREEYVNEPLKGLSYFRDYFPELQYKLEKEIRKLENNSDMTEHALHIYHYQELFEPVKRLWATWYLNKELFEHHHFLYNGIHNNIIFELMFNKLSGNLYYDFYNRLLHVEFDKRHPFDFINRYDQPEAFHFINPPYMHTNCLFQQSDFTEESLHKLLQLVSRLRGKFLLILPAHQIVAETATLHNWKYIGYVPDPGSPLYSLGPEKYVLINYELQSSGSLK